MPNQQAPQNVNAKRETPGKSAIPCKKPRMTAFKNVIFSYCFMLQNFNDSKKKAEQANPKPTGNNEKQNGSCIKT